MKRKSLDLSGKIDSFMVELFEVIADWGNYARIELTRNAYRRKMVELVELLDSLDSQACVDVAFFPSVDEYRRELLFFARLFAELTGASPDYDAIARQYWNRVYAIYDHLPEHVDPRSRMAVDKLIRYFQEW